MEVKPLPKLLVSKEHAYQQLETQIEKGKKLQNQSVPSEDQLDKIGLESENWSKYNIDLLTQLFGDFKPTSEYVDFRHTLYSYEDKEDICSLYAINFLDYHLNEYKTRMVESINSLEGIRDRLELLNEPDLPARIFGNKIFIVHGHEEAAKHKIARFIDDLDLTATILDEQPSRGQTIIDKFEEHAEEAGFAIVLLTADDIGAPKSKPNDQAPRARQNVILELGYFLCGLGRERVCVLYEEGVELPSDIHGLSYVPLDSADGWKLKLTREMREVGFTIDMNKIF